MFWIFQRCKDFNFFKLIGTKSAVIILRSTLLDLRLYCKVPRNSDLLLQWSNLSFTTVIYGWFFLRNSDLLWSRSNNFFTAVDHCCQGSFPIVKMKEIKILHLFIRVCWFQYFSLILVSFYKRNLKIYKNLRKKFTPTHPIIYIP